MVEKKESVCEEADRIVSSDRQGTYGHPSEDFLRTAQLLTALGFRRVNKGIPCEITKWDIPQMMRMVKESRLTNYVGHRDSLVDICGYAKTEEMLYE